MSKSAPGKHFRKGMSLVEIMRMFPDDAAAEKWFVERRWPDGVTCPCCGSINVQTRPTRKPQPYRCRDCRKDFSTKTGTLMQGSKLGFQTWAVAIYLMATSLKSVSSMKLHRDLGVTQKTAWFLAQRIRETWTDNSSPFSGPVEADETYMGGKRRNMSNAKRRALKTRAAALSASPRSSGPRTARRTASPRSTSSTRTCRTSRASWPIRRRSARSSTPMRLRSITRSSRGTITKRSTTRRASTCADGAYQRDRELLVDAQACLPRHVPQALAEALAALHRRVPPASTMSATPTPSTRCATSSPAWPASASPMPSDRRQRAGIGGAERLKRNRPAGWQARRGGTIWRRHPLGMGNVPRGFAMSRGEIIPFPSPPHPETDDPRQTRLLLSKLRQALALLEEIDRNPIAGLFSIWISTATSRPLPGDDSTSK